MACAGAQAHFKSFSFGAAAYLDLLNNPPSQLPVFFLILLSFIALQGIYWTCISTSSSEWSWFIPSLAFKTLRTGKSSSSSAESIPASSSSDPTEQNECQRSSFGLNATSLTSSYSYSFSSAIFWRGSCYCYQIS